MVFECLFRWKVCFYIIYRFYFNGIKRVNVLLLLFGLLKWYLKRIILVINKGIESKGIYIKYYFLNIKKKVRIISVKIKYIYKLIFSYCILELFFYVIFKYVFLYYLLM